MGITGFLPKLKTIQKPITLEQLHSKKLAVDGYSWLHKATVGCSHELTMGLNTRVYLNYFIKRIRLLKQYDIKPYFVFDGARINVKAGTEKERLNRRILYKKRGQSLWNAGRYQEAQAFFRRCVDVTPEMAKLVIDYCKDHSIEFIVAPFEADSQMVYLENQKLVDGVISEDSDLLIFGCKNLITKLNDIGEAKQIESKNFDKLPKPFRLSELTPDEIRLLVCISGCDYTKGLPHIGLSFGYDYVKDCTAERIVSHVLGMERITKERAVEFLKEYHFANYSFQFQRVFCPIKQKLVTLNEIPSKYLDSKEQSDILFSSIGNPISKHTGKREVLSNFDNIDHEMHRLISIGERHPTEYYKPLESREDIVTRKREAYYSSPQMYFKLWNRYAPSLPFDPAYFPNYIMKGIR